MAAALPLAAILAHFIMASLSRYTVYHIARAAMLAFVPVINAVVAFWAQYHCRHARNPHPDPA